jgi:GT2 family glycosyltransferase
MPVVSIVIPTYQRLAFLREAVDSVFAQTFADWELIVVDDGSTDGTDEYLSTLHDRRVRTVWREHSGNAARTRNAGVTLATGEWIAFLDSDDVWLPRKLELQLAALAKHLNCLWSCTAVSYIDDAGRPAVRIHPRKEPASGWILDRLLMFEAAVPAQTMLVRRSLFRDVGGFDETFDFCEDFDLDLRLAAYNPICALAEPLTLIREHGARTTSMQRPAVLHAASARAFQKAAAAATTRKTRRLATREAAVQVASQARAHSIDGDHRTALSLIGHTLIAEPFTLQFWRLAAGCARRALGASQVRSIR